MATVDEFQRLEQAILIDGSYRKSSASDGRDIINPATEERLSSLAETTPEEIDAAVDVAQAAQKGWWRKSALERAEIMHDIANDLHAMKPRLAKALTLENGQALQGIGG